VSRIGSPVDFDDNVHGRRFTCVDAKFIDDFGNEAALAFITHAYAAIRY
jgi:hypothetical protein